MAKYIHTYNHRNEIGVLLEFHADDDFTFKTEEFRELATMLGIHIAAKDPAADSHGREVLSLLNQRYLKDESMTVREFIESFDLRLKANLKVGRYQRFAIK